MKTYKLNMMLPFFILLPFCNKYTMAATQALKTDTFPTPSGSLEINHIGYAALYLIFDGKTIHVDPCGQMAYYSKYNI